MHRYKWHRLMPDRQIQSEKDRADYWESAASMWHENYRQNMHFEVSARRYEEALERLATGRYTGERVRQIALKALAGVKQMPEV